LNFIFFEQFCYYLCVRKVCVFHIVGWLKSVFLDELRKMNLVLFGKTKNESSVSENRTSKTKDKFKNLNQEI